jgi:hypothetical protein
MGDFRHRMTKFVELFLEAIEATMEPLVVELAKDGNLKEVKIKIYCGVSRVPLAITKRWEILGTEMKLGNCIHFFFVSFAHNWPILVYFSELNTSRTTCSNLHHPFKMEFVLLCFFFFFWCR